MMDEGATMNGSRYYEVRSEGTKYGIGFGSALAIAISYTTNKSILWAIIRGLRAGCTCSTSHYSSRKKDAEHGGPFRFIARVSFTRGVPRTARVDRR